MYLQFAPPAKKFHSTSSMPHFSRDRPQGYASSAVREEAAKRLPATPFSSNGFVSHLEPPQAQTDRPYINERYKTEGIADDLKALHKGFRNMITDGGNHPTPSNNHTKHRILNRHLGKG